MSDKDNTQAELRVTPAESSEFPNLSMTQRTYLARREWMELAFILLYPVFMPLPILNVLAGILSGYAVLSLTIRGKLGLTLVASAVALGLSSIIRLGDTPPEFNAALLVMSTAPILALALGFRLFASMQSAFMLMALVTTTIVGVVFALGGEAIGGIFDELKKLSDADPAMNATMMSQLIDTLRWLTPALIASQILLPLTLAWYLAPTIERVISGGRTVELATSHHFRWLTLTQWRLPRFTLTLLFIFAAGRLAAGAMGLEDVTRVCDNLLLITALTFSVTGFSLVEYVFRRFRVSWLMRGLFYFLAIASALPGTVFLAIVGLSDTQFDLRSKIPSRTADKTGA